MLQREVSPEKGNASVRLCHSAQLCSQDLPPSPGRRQHPYSGPEGSARPAPHLPDLRPPRFSATLTSLLFLGHRLCSCSFISLCVTTFLLVTMSLSPYLFAQVSPFQWCLCYLPSSFKFQSLSTASLSSPGGHSPAEEVTGCHQLGTTFGRAASPAFTLESCLSPSVSLGESRQRPCLWQHHGNLASPFRSMILPELPWWELPGWRLPPSHRGVVCVMGWVCSRALFQMDCFCPMAFGLVCLVCFACFSSLARPFLFPFSMRDFSLSLPSETTSSELSQLSVSLTTLTFHVFLAFFQKPKLHLIRSWSVSASFPSY